MKSFARRYRYLQCVLGIFLAHAAPVWATELSLVAPKPTQRPTGRFKQVDPVYAVPTLLFVFFLGVYLLNPLPKNTPPPIKKKPGPLQAPLPAPDQCYQIVLSKVVQGGVKQVNVSQQSLHDLAAISPYNYIRQHQRPVQTSILMDTPPLYKLRVSRTNIPQNDLTKNDLTWSFCKSNQSVHAYLVEKKLYGDQKTIYLYFKEDTSLLQKNTRFEKSYDLTLYAGNDKPIKMRLRGSDDLLNSVKQKRNHLIPNEIDETPIFFYGKIDEAPTRYEKEQWASRKAGDQPIWISEMPQLTIAQLAIDSCSNALNDPAVLCNKRLTLTLIYQADRNGPRFLSA